MLMKKITFFALLSVFFAVAALAASPETRGRQALNATAVMTSPVKHTPKAQAFHKVQTPMAVNYKKMARKVKAGVRKAPRKVEIADIFDMDWMLCSQYYEYSEEAGGLTASTPATGGTPIKLTWIDGQTIGIEGFTYDATETIQATFAVTTDEELKAQGIVAEISIADGQTLLESDYGPIVLYNASFENEGDPIKAYFYETGVIAFDGLWVAAIGGDGQYAGYTWSPYCLSWGAPANGTMSWAEDEETIQIPVYIEQDPDNAKTVTVYNFAGMETAIDVTMKEDKSFVISEQPMFYYNSEYGYFYVSGLLISGGYYYLNTLAGVGTENTLTFNGNWMFYSPTKGTIYQSYEPATITLNAGEFAYPVIEDVAAVPADPSILGVGNYDETKGYGYVSFTVPTTDIDGNDLKEANLFYQLYSDIDGEIQPITFTTDLYVKIEEDMSIIPYTFTDNYDFADNTTYKVVYLNYNFNLSYDRIGVKSIYTGGGETNESEIAWADVEKAEPAGPSEATFDFNAMDVPTSSSVTHDGDITDEVDFIEGNVTLTISPKAEGATYNNRFWSTSNGPQLRVYSGTLTFTVPEGSLITQIVFNHNGKWGDNTVEDEVIPNDTETKAATWTGSAQTVVVSIAANSQINSITVTVEEAPDELVTLPEGVVAETWTIEGSFNTNSGSRDVQMATEVAFDGTDIYVKGLSYYFEDAWLKGTIYEDSVVTFASGQFVGEDEYGKEYMLGFDESEAICDIQFAYDAEAKKLTQVTPYIGECGSKTELAALWGYWTDVVYYEGEPIVPEPVVAPEDLATEAYVFKAFALEYGYEEDTERPDYSIFVNVGFDGDDAYIQGLATDMPELWVKATKNEEGKYVIPANQFMGNFEFWGYTFPYYWTAVDEAGACVDAVLDYDAETNTFTTDQTLALNGSANGLDYYLLYTDVIISKFEETAATPANPTFEAFNITDMVGYSTIYASIPAVDTEGENLNPSKLFYTVWIEKNGERKPYVFNAELYSSDFEEDVVEVPYNHDGYDIYNGGEVIYLEDELEELASWTNVGIQSIYYGAGERRESEIQWAYVLDENEGYAAIYGESSFQTVNVKYSLTAGWNTIVLPFVVEDLSAFGEGAKAYELTDVEDGVLSVNTVAELKANTPYIIYATEAKASLSFDITEFVEPTSLSVEKNGVTFQGTYTAIAAPGMEGKYGVTGEGSILKGSDKASIKGFRAYFEAAPGTQIKAISFDGEDATGISLTPALSEGEGAVYNLAGQRIQKAQKGVNIVNGKKVLY